MTQPGDVLGILGPTGRQDDAFKRCSWPGSCGALATTMHTSRRRPLAGPSPSPTDHTTVLPAIALLSLVTVEFGGWALLGGGAFPRWTVQHVVKG